MIRLGFRDILWYCYLDQDKLDNSFFRLDDPVLQSKSRHAIRYVLGYYTERLEILQSQLSKAASDRIGKLIAARQMREFLQEVGYASEKDVQADIEEVDRQLKATVATKPRWRPPTRSTPTSPTASAYVYEP